METAQRLKRQHFFFIKMFILGITILLLAVSIFLYLQGSDCGTCNSFGYFNPLGFKNDVPSDCSYLCVYTPHPSYYFFTDLTVLFAFILVILHQKSRLV